MGVKIRNVSRIQQTKKAIQELASRRIEVGVFGTDGAEYVMIARVHEFGITIQQKKSKITIPERSFLRATFDEEKDAWFEFVRKRMPQIVLGSMGVERLLNQLGAKMVADIQEKITDLDSPPNAPSTIAQKGSSNPLIDTGGLRRRITFKVVST